MLRKPRDVISIACGCGDLEHVFLDRRIFGGISGIWNFWRVFRNSAFVKSDCRNIMDSP